MTADHTDKTPCLAAKIVLLVALLAAAGSATAQDDMLEGGETRTQMAADPPDAPIQPLSGLESIPLEVTYVYQEGGASFVTTPIEITVADRPSWATVSVTPSTVYVPVQDGQGGEGTVTTNVIVQAAADAPAFKQGTIELAAEARQNGNLGPSRSTTTIPIQAGFYSVVDAQTPKPVVVTGPQDKVEFPIAVSNFGNGDQTVSLSVSQADEDLDVVLPGTFTVPTRADGGDDNVRTAIVSVQTPFQNGYMNVPGTFSLDVTSAYALDQSNSGMSTRVSALITTKGFFVPGPGLGLVLAGFAGVALATRRRR